MALRTAWWMKSQPTGQVPSPIQPQKPHQGWPWNHSAGGISFGILEKTLKEKVGLGCQVDQYVYQSSMLAHPIAPLGSPSLSASRPRPRWFHRKTASNVNDLVTLLTQALPTDVHSVIYVTTFLQAEAIQALGHYLSITPRFFNFPYIRLSTGNTVEQYLFYSVQFMDKYDSGRKPSEAQRLDTSPTYRFRAATGGYIAHEWHVTCIRLIFMKDADGKHFRGLVQIDPIDDAVADGLKTLMTRDEDIPPGDAEEYAGLGQILSETIYLMSYTWTAFLMEAEAHLQILSKKCVDESLTASEQLQYTRELHQISPLWVQVRRRLIATKDLVAQIVEHPFFASIGGYNGRVAIEGYLSKRTKNLEDQVSQCNELADQTNVLISLIFNIATLQDTRAAVEESKAANAFAASIRRVTMLTFVYLPLTLASSIFGMNISQITGEGSHSPLWAYFTIAVSLMVATFGGWFLWSRVLSRMERKARLKVSLPLP